MIDSRDPQAVTAAVNDWLQTIVIGLGLCPFASKPARENTIFTQVVYPDSEEALLEELQALLTKWTTPMPPSLKPRCWSFRNCSRISLTTTSF